MEGAGFAQSMGAFGNMLKIQESISELLPESRVPWNESRKFLKANTIENIKSTPLYKFHRDLFKKIGLGDIQLIGYAPMHYIFGVPDCPVCNLYPALNNQKVCAATTDALYRFFTEDLELECSVEEIECTKDGGQICKFKVDLQPISAYQIMLDETDRKILNGQGLTDIDPDELNRRKEILTVYKLLENGQLSEIGKTYMQFAGNMPVQEKIFDPPWKAREELASIAKDKGTFGAAFGSMKEKIQASGDKYVKNTAVSPKARSEGTGMKEHIPEGNKPDSGKSESFAELLSKMKKNKKD